MRRRPDGHHEAAVAGLAALDAWIAERRSRPRYRPIAPGRIIATWRRKAKNIAATAQVLGCSQTRVRDLLVRRGLHRPRRYDCGEVARAQRLDRTRWTLRLLREGRSPTEIGDRLGLSKSAAWSWITTCRQWARRHGSYDDAIAAACTRSEAMCRAWATRRRRMRSR